MLWVFGAFALSGKSLSISTHDEEVQLSSMIVRMVREDCPLSS